MNPDIRDGVKVRAITTAPSPNNVAICRGADGRITEDDGMLFFPVGGAGRCIYWPGKFDLTGCFRVVKEPRKMTVREVAEVLSKQTAFAGYLVMCEWRANGKKAAESALSGLLGEEVEIVEGE